MLLKNNIYAFIANFFIPLFVIFAMNNISQSILILPAVGIGVISALVWGYRIIPALYLSQLFLGFIIHPEESFQLNHLLLNNLFILIGLIRSYLGAYLMRLFIGHPNPLISNIAIVKFFLVIGPLIAIASTTLNFFVTLFLDFDRYSVSLLSNYYDWWFGDYMGFIIFAPLLLVVIGQPKSVWRPRYLTLALPVLFTLLFIIFLYNKTEYSDKEEWKLNFQTTQAYVTNYKDNNNKLVAIIGLIFTGLLSMILLIITGKNTLIDLKVKERSLNLDIKINNFEEEKKQYQKLIEHHPVVLWRQNIKTNQLTYISNKVKELYGFDCQKWLTIPNFRYERIVNEDREHVANTISRAIANRDSFELEYRFIRADSSIAWVKDIVSFNKDKKGNAQLVGLMIDTTETHEAKTKQNISESKYEILFKQAPEPMILIDLESHLFKDCNDKANSLFGLDNLLDTLTLSDLSPIKQSDGSLSSSRLDKIYKILFTKDLYRFEWKMHNKSHEEIICKIEFIKLPETKNKLILASIIDVTKIRQHERKINQLAYYDQLTSLPNREYFYSKFEFFHKLAKNKKQFGTIIYLDLDRFKLLNDSLGHHTGDKLLEIVAKRIKNTSKNNDFCARLAGDEFIILTRSLEKNIQTALEQSLVKSELILEALNEPYQLGDYEHFITPSIGISVFPNKNSSLDEIVHQADIAMYASKDKGKNTITVFQESMIQQVAKKLHLEKAIKDAIDKKEFELHYQIKVDEHQNTTSAEALLRWNRLKEFNIDTEKLIETIDTVGLTNELGNWVLDQACYQLKKWKGKSPIKSLSINISPKQLHQKLFVEQIISVVSNYKIKPERITLELTESVLFDNQKILIEKLQALRKYGIKISLDDFGTGYSSLAYLQKLPIDELKIDKMFIDNLTQEKSSQYVIKTILTLAKSMGIELIVEGIETKQQFKILKDLGVKYFQGYYFAKAQTAKQLSQLD